MLDAPLTLTWAFTNEATPFTAPVLESLKMTRAVTSALVAVRGDERLCLTPNAGVRSSAARMIGVLLVEAQS